MMSFVFRLQRAVTAGSPGASRGHLRRLPVFQALVLLLLQFGMTGSAAAEVFISEFLASNATSMTDADRHTSDWIELHNPDPDPVNLEGWFLTDDSRRLDKWRLPAVVLAPNEYRVIFASGKDRTNAASELHASFNLSAVGEFLGLVRPDGITLASAYPPAFPSQATDISYGLAAEAGSWVPRYFATPTPGQPNGEGFAGIAPPPSFSRPGGTFTDPFDLEITAATPGAEIRYTFDGSPPSPASTLYVAPLRLGGTRVLRARCFVPGLVPSPITGAAFTRLGPGVRASESDLPLVVIDTFSRSIAEGSRNPVYLAFYERNPASGRTTLQSLPGLTSRAGIEIRGSSSAGFDKKSYGFELQNEAGLDLPGAPLGLPSDSDWILYAPYTDKSLIRDVLAYELSRSIGRYAPRTRFVELYLNRGNTDLEAADYQGVYVLMEKVKISPARVDLAEIEPDDLAEPAISGGYLLKRDRFDANDQVLTTSRGVQLGIEDPKRTQIGTLQRNWIRDWLNQMERTLYGSTWRDPIAGYVRYLDPGSFSDHQWLVETAKNIDGYRLSTFWFKDRSGRLQMGPIWDYNLTFGNANYLNGWLTSGWYWSQVSDPGYLWLRRLFQDPDFSQLHLDRWFQLRAGPFANPAVLQLVDRLASEVTEAQTRNFQRWRILGTYVWPNWYVAQTWPQEIAWMKQWLTNRLAWIDRQFIGPPASSHPAGHYPQGLDLSLLPDRGLVYLTLEGADPRLPGGAIFPSARIADQTLRLDANARVFARSRSGTNWSAPFIATYVVRTPALAITEIMFHPAPAGAGPEENPDDREFVEIRNTGTEPVSLPGAQIGGSIQFVFPPDAGLLLPGEHVVVARRRDAWPPALRLGIRLLGDYSGRLPNSGGTLSLAGPLGEPIQEFTYDDSWYRTTDGQGFSLTVLDDRAPANRWSQASNWRPSLAAGGTPGRANVLDQGPPVLVCQPTSPDGLRLTLRGNAGIAYTLLSTTNLVSGTWTRVIDLVATAAGTVETTVPATADGSPRFYRAVTPRP